MEEEGIGVVLSRATELRLKISHCVHQATTGLDETREEEEEEEEGEKTEAGVGVEEERLLGICDAFEALESQLSSLQMMQQNHRYEREVALAEIDYSRKMLLDKLKDYKGNDLDVIQEASAFAGEDVEHDTSLLLPPYPSRPPLHLSNFSFPHKSIRNGAISSGPSNDSIAHADNTEESQPQDHSSTGGSGLGHMVGAVSKTVVTVVGIVTMLSLACSRSKCGKNNYGPLRDLQMLLGIIVRGRSEPSLRCPPGRVPVMENGEARCLVKERVEVPFEPVVATRDVNYGCG